MKVGNRYSKLCIWALGLLLWGSTIAHAKTVKDNILYRIGFIHPRSGPLAPFGNSLAQGVKLGLQQFRQEYPKLGAQISLISADDHGLASEGEKAAQRLVHGQKVHFLIGSLSNTVNLSIAAVTKQSDSILLLPRGSDEELLSYARVFSMSLTDRRQGELIAKFVAKNLRRNKAIILTDSQTPEAEVIGQGFANAFTQLGGQVLNQWKFASHEQPLKEILDKLSNIEPAIIFFPGSYRAAPLFLTEARKLGIKNNLVGSDGWDHEHLYAMNPELLGNQYYFAYFHGSDPQAGVQNFISDYESAYGQKPDVLAALGYDSIRVALQSYVMSKSSQPEQLLKSLEGAHFPSIYGAGHFSKDHVYLRPYPIISTSGGHARFYSRVLLEL